MYWLNCFLKKINWLNYGFACHLNNAVSELTHLTLSIGRFGGRGGGVVGGWKGLIEPPGFEKC